MPVKRYLKKTNRQKKLIQSLPTVKNQGQPGVSDSSNSNGEAIIRQFHQIQKGYYRLVGDVAKELTLVKGWIGYQASVKRNDIKARLSARLSRN